MSVINRAEEIHQVKIKEIVPHPDNRNIHGSDQIDRLAKIIKYQGFRSPLIISKRSGLLISGHGRLLAAEKLKLKTLPVIYQDFEDEDQEYAAMVSENSIASWAELNLAEINTDLAGLDPSFDIEMLGLKNFTIEPADKYADKDADNIPDVKQNEMGVQLGDIYQLGDHRLMCGDSTDLDSIKFLMQDEKAEMVFTDPPYGIGFEYKNYKDTEENWYELINKIIPIAKEVSPFVVMPCCRIVALKWWYENHSPDWVMCWYKGSPGHRSKVGFNDWEPHLVWGKPKNQIHDYWQTACGFEKNGHPCPKPVEYSQWIIERAIDKDDICLDLFSGSGSGLIASEKTGRRFYGLELDPHYVSIILKRWQDFTAKKATKLNK